VLDATVDVPEEGLNAESEEDVEDESGGKDAEGEDGGEDADADVDVDDEGEEEREERDQHGDEAEEDGVSNSGYTGVFSSGQIIFSTIFLHLAKRVFTKMTSFN